MVIGKALERTRMELMKSGTEDFDFDAHQLVLHVLGISPIMLAVLKNEEISAEADERLKTLTQRRVDGYPLQYLLGEWEFYGLPFKVGEGVLIPRPDTERLAELAVKFLKGREKPVAVDLCSGSGCIAVAIASKAKTEVFAVELSEKAAEYLEENIALNNCKKNVTIVKGDIFDERVYDKIPQVDAILSNPPYLSREDMERLQREVKSEPQMALFGGESGYDFYERIFNTWIAKLKDGGLFAVEIGIDQHEKVSEYMRAAGIEPHYERDYGGIIRVIYGIKK